MTIEIESKLKVNVETLDGAYSECDIELSESDYKHSNGVVLKTMCRLRHDEPEKNRWRTTYRCIYRTTDAEHNSSYWRCYREEGNTEDCDAQGYGEDEQGFVELCSVKRIEKTIVDFE